MAKVIEFRRDKQDRIGSELEAIESSMDVVIAAFEQHFEVAESRAQERFEEIMAKIESNKAETLKAIEKPSLNLVTADRDD